MKSGSECLDIGLTFLTGMTMWAIESPIFIRIRRVMVFMRSEAARDRVQAVLMRCDYTAQPCRVLLLCEHYRKSMVETFHHTFNCHL